MSSYPFFIPEFVLCANSSLFSFKIANEPSEFHNYLKIFTRSDAVVLFPEHGSLSYYHFSQEHIQAAHRMALLPPASG